MLPVDERGRVWVSKERRKALLEEFDRSGMSAHVAHLRYISGGSEGLKIVECESGRMRIDALSDHAPVYYAN